MNAENTVNPKIIVKDLSFYYGDYCALKNINLSILSWISSALVFSSPIFIKALKQL